MNKTTIVGLIIGILIVGGIFWYTQYQSALEQPRPSNSEQGESDSWDTVPAGSGMEDGPAGKVAGYTLGDIAAHNSEASCWTAVNGKVYDVTAWIPQHPGGPQKILALCGKDGSSAFEGQHGGMEGPETALAQFEIGVLQ